MTLGLFVSTKCMTGFTHMHLPLVSDYLRVLLVQQDLLTSMTHTTGFTRKYSVITREYKSAQQELLVSNFHSSAIAHEQCTSHVTRVQHTSYLQIFSRHETLLAFFVNLDVSCTVLRETTNATMIPQTSRNDTLFM